MVMESWRAGVEKVTSTQSWGKTHTFSVMSGVRKHCTDRISCTVEPDHNGGRGKRKGNHTAPIFTGNFDILFIMDCWH